MSVRINNSADCWAEGVFCVPKAVAEKNMNFADEKKLKTLLLILSEGGAVNADELSEKLKISKSEVEEAIEFWLGEGILVDDNSPEVKPSAVEEAEVKKSFEALPVPNLTPKDIVAMCAENPELSSLLQSAQQILSSTLSHSMKSNLVNMATYYGLPVPVIITLLEYYNTERQAGKSITTRHLQIMARQWAEDEVSSLEDASRKLQELKDTDELWGDVIALCEFDYKKPSSAQRKMVCRWMNDFENEMIFFACNTMKKYNDEEKRSIKQVDNILKEWKRKGFKTPEDVKAQPKKDKKKKSGKLESKPSFDIDEIEMEAILNDDFDI